MKEVYKQRLKKYRQSKIGLISVIYSHQKGSSKKRNHPAPNYSKQDLINWCLSKPIFHVLFKEWEKSEFHTYLSPSIDRKNDNIPYTMNNIQLMTWEENRLKGLITRDQKVYDKISRKVIKIDGCTQTEYRSAREANRETNINFSNIAQCCRGNKNSAGGFKWRYADVQY